MATHLLLIDDNPDQVTITTRTLARTGEPYEIQSASTAKEGLEKIMGNAVDLILCDYRLPDMTGIDVLRQLKQRGNERPFIIVTASGNERLAVEAIQLGAYDYVVKDASYEQLLPAVIHRAVARHQERREHQQLEADRKGALEALKKEKKELERMNSAMMDRERRVLQLKEEVNALLDELKRPPKYRM